MRGEAFLNYGTLMIGMTNQKQIVLGKDVDINGCLSVGKKGEIVLGDYSLVGPRSLIQALNKIETGKFCYIGPDVLITDSNHHSIYAKDRMIDALCVNKGLSGVNAITKPIKLGDHVWIGRRAFIFKGISIGDRSIIAAGSVVTHNVPSDVIVAGNPAKVVKIIDQDHINPDEIFPPEEILKMNRKTILRKIVNRKSIIKK